MATPAPLGPAIAETVYDDPKAVKDALQAHAGQNGYSITISSSNERRVFYMCSKSGKYDAKGKVSTTHESKRRKNTSTMKTDCKYQCVAQKLDTDDGWKLEVLNNNHNHGLVSALSALPAHIIAAITPEERVMVCEMYVLSHSPIQILNKLRHDKPDCTLIPHATYNLLVSMRVEELDGKTPIEWLL
jgi:hypothetical protein